MLLEQARDEITDALTPRDDTTLEKLIADASAGKTSRHQFDYRDLASGVAGSGGFLVSPRTLAPENPLPPESVAAQAGVRALTLPVPSGAPVQPVWDSLPSFEWLPTEASEFTNQTPTLRAVATSLKLGGAYLRVGYQLNRQSNAVENLRSLLRQVAAIGIDSGFFAGAGVAGAPLGLANTQNVNSVSGASLGWTGITDMEEAVALNNAADANLVFVGHPGVRKLLRRREKITGGGVPIWDDNTIAGHLALVSTTVPAATLFGGDFSNALIVLGGPLEVLVNPYNTQGYKTGAVDLAVFVAMDLIVTFPPAFVIATSIT